jgi:hypothetical protein
VEWNLSDVRAETGRRHRALRQIPFQIIWKSKQKAFIDNLMNAFCLPKKLLKFNKGAEIK